MTAKFPPAIQPNSCLRLLCDLLTGRDNHLATINEVSHMAGLTHRVHLGPRRAAKSRDSVAEMGGAAVNADACLWHREGLCAWEETTGS